MKKGEKEEWWEKGRFQCQRKRCVRDRCWIMLWKRSTCSNTCLALNVEEKGLRMEESTEARQAVEEAKGGLHSAKLPSYEGAYQSQQALIITQQCPNWLTATALLQCFTSLLPGWPSYEVFNRCLLLGSHLVFLPSLLSFLPLSAGELLSLQRAKSRGASLLSAADEGPTGNHPQPLYEAVWLSEWTQHPSTFHRQSW